MQLNMYTIYDEGAKAYATPFFLHNDAVALRAFADNINGDGNSNLSKHPDQFTLFCVGTFDDSNGLITAVPPRTLGNGLQYMTPKPIHELGALVDEFRALMESSFKE